MDKNKIKKIIKILAVIIIVVIAGLIFLTLAPESGGYKALVVTSSSMEPTISTGSMVFVKKVESVGNNDIVTFRMGLDPRSLTTHRIVDTKDVKGRAMYQTKGDAVGQPDVELVPLDRIVGRVMFSLPYIGYPIAFGKTQMGVVVLVVIPAAIIVYEELRSMGREVALLRKKVGKLEREEKLSKPQSTLTSRRPPTATQLQVGRSQVAQLRGSGVPADFSRKKNQGPSEKKK